MNINSAFPSSYVKAADLNGKRATVTMARVEMQDIGGDHKPVLFFRGTEKGLVLNKTNAAIITDLYGPETDEWAGKKILLYPARVEFQGKIVDAIRVQLSTPEEVDTQAPLPTRREPDPAPASYAMAKNGNSGVVAPQSRAGVMDDEIPF